MGKASSLPLDWSPIKWSTLYLPYVGVSNNKNALSYFRRKCFIVLTTRLQNNGRHSYQFAKKFESLFHNYIDIHTYIYMYMCIYTYTQLYMYIYVYIYLYLYIYIYIYLLIYLFIYLCTCLSSVRLAVLANTGQAYVFLSILSCLLYTSPSPRDQA